MNLDIIKKHEGLRLESYQDSVGVWTIGFGNTFYKDGSTVKKGDRITRQQAEELLELVAGAFAKQVDKLVGRPLNTNQRSALLSFAYNVGLGNLQKSTLLKKVKVNPDDPTIRAEFRKWIKAGGKVLNGLVKRRNEEADLYFTKVTQ